MEKKYIFIADNINLPELNLTKGGVYYGTKINEILEKYKNLSKLLVDVEILSTVQKEKNYLDKIRENLIEEIKGGE